MKLAPRWIPLLALVSGAPALVDQVVWTREVGLLAGSQIEAVSVVVATFFGGLALGAAWLGPLADRTESPLRLYAAFEIVSGAAAALSTLPLRALGPDAAGWSGAPLLVACAAVLLPIALLMGGTLPALLRAAGATAAGLSRHAGRVVGANTLGAVIGVGIAVAAIPQLGLAATVRIAGGFAVAIGAAAFALAGHASAVRPAPAARATARVRAAPTAAAAIVGVATLGTEVLATRLAMLRLGSSLYAWGIVLGLFLAGLALGNLAFARRAERSDRPAAAFGWIETFAAVAVAVGMVALRPDPARPPDGLTPRAIGWVLASVFPAAFAMGGAFPLLVRLAARGERVGASFGAVSAVNTAGGIAGALALPFALLPALGAVGSACALAALDAAVAWWAFGAGPARWRDRGIAAFALVAAALYAGAPRAPAASPWVIFADEGRQATVVVTVEAGERTLWVDGDPEASTAGDARRTEMLLAALPLLLNPGADAYLEVGLGSGITLGTASRFGLGTLDCVEIADSVIRASAYFAPDNRDAVARARVVHADARVFLTAQPERYDVISANTLHPWSVGATGLYSREYYGRLRAALRPGGIAVQWVPTARIGADSVASILVTFFDAFEEGSVWWAAGNLILTGSDRPHPAPDAGALRRRLAGAGLDWSAFGLTGPDDLQSRRLADAADVRLQLAARAPLSDDRPVLEHRAARSRTARRQADVFALLTELARDARPGARLWLESLEARARGSDERADGRERLAVDAGFDEARLARARRLARRGARAFAEGRLDEAERSLDEALALRPGLREAALPRIGLDISRGRSEAARAGLDAWLAAHPDDAVGWNELAGVRAAAGDTAGARDAARRAVEANPFHLESIANAGLLAAGRGDRAEARQRLARLRELSPNGVGPLERSLAEALGPAGRPGS